MVTARSFYSSRSDNYIVPQGLTGSLGVVGNLLQYWGFMARYS
jgi:hypothetical protein